MEKKLKHLFNQEIYDLFIVRHPEVENHKDNIFNGTNDVDLSEEGYLQTEKLFRFFQDKNIDTVISSPMKRCRIVANKFKDYASILFDERIRERSFGIFERLSWSEVEKKYPKEAKLFLQNPFSYRVKNGESFLDVKNRVVPFIKQVLTSKKNTLIIAHGGVNRVIVSYLLDMKEEAILKISQDYACINHFKSDGNFVLCKSLNKDIV